MLHGNENYFLPNKNVRKVLKKGFREDIDRNCICCQYIVHSAYCFGNTWPLLYTQSSVL